MKQIYQKMSENNASESMRNIADPAYEPNGVPEKLWLYEENIKQLYELDKTPDRKTFLDDFFNYRKKNGLYSKIPVIARRPLDVYALYCIVQKYGGFESTMKNRMWSQIARELDLPRTMTSGAFTLKLKYIRLLYQFECHKCNKPVNQAILYNESMIGENKERYEEHVDDYHLRNQMQHRDEFDEYIQEKEKIYREALRRSTEKDFVVPIRPERHDIDRPPDVLSVPHGKTISTIDDQSPSSSLHYTHRYSPPDRPTPLKRGFQRHEMDHPPDVLSAAHGKTIPTIDDQLPSSSLHYTHRYSPPDRPTPMKRGFQVSDIKDSSELSCKRHTKSNIQRDDIFKTFSVDFFEITDDMVNIKVCLNDERYEGVLKCC